jgi:hypothetical protein
MRLVVKVLLIVGAIVIALLLIALAVSPPSNTHAMYPSTTRAEALPVDVNKGTPSNDEHPPVLLSSEWYDPIPLPGPINTLGAEDSPFILHDSSAMYFFFTPDVRISPNRQLMDNVTGIWCSQWNGTGWSEPQRVWLQDAGILSLDGAEFVDGDTMWFASAREGYQDMNWFTAARHDGVWNDWQYAGDVLNKQYQVGELHISKNGTEMYFHSDRAGGKGGLDLWVTTLVDEQWQEPVNLEVVNSASNDGYPFLSQDGNELWFTRTYMGTPAIYRSIKVDGAWTTPQMIVSSFAGEPTLDQQGNLYFVHHFYKDNVMIEADIYVAYKK